MAEHFDYKIVLMICSNCKSCYLRDHPENRLYLKCGLCGFSVKRTIVAQAVEEAMRAGKRVIH